MSLAIDILLLSGILLVMVMLWKNGKHICHLANHTASAFERTRQEIARDTASALEGTRQEIARGIASELEGTRQEIARDTASALEGTRQEIARGIASELEEWYFVNDQKLKQILEGITYADILISDLHSTELEVIQKNKGLQYSFAGQESERPIFIATVFKSGTKLLEHIVAKLTGLDINAPTMSAGSDYESTDPISFKKGQFFIWHNVPGNKVRARLIAANARPVFLVRNIYDLIVSQYYHFALDVDAEIGYATHTESYFAEIGQDEGLSLVISGATSERFNWHGFGYYLHQIQEMLQFSKEYPCHIVVYDRLVLDKRYEVERLARFLNIEPDKRLLDELISSSSLNSMREARASLAGAGKHFRKGVPGDHVNVLKQHHYDMINHTKRFYAPKLDALCAELEFGDIVACEIKSPAL